MEIQPVTLANALHVALNMRAADREEIYATRWTDNPLDLARDCVRLAAFSWCFCLDGAPVAILGAGPMHPGVWSAYMFATDWFRKIRFSMTRHVRRVMLPALVDAGCHRVQCHSMEGHAEAHAWLESFGSRREGRLVGYGRNGEDFLTYVWTPAYVQP